MKKIITLISLLLTLFVLSGCNFSVGNKATAPAPTATKAVVVVPKAATATNFPQFGTPTPVPPTRTPNPTATSTPYTRDAMFDDETLASLMKGTIDSTGVDSVVKIVDDRATGGERLVHVTIVTEYNIADSDFLFKLFILDVGSALRTIRNFNEGTFNADLDAAYLLVNDPKGKELGSVSTNMSVIIDYLDGKTTVDQALSKAEITGVFREFLD